MSKIEIPIFKIRCSKIGDIMINERGKTTMGKVAKSYCELWLKEQVYGKRKEINSKYLDKGNFVENDSIQFISKMLNLGMIFKNEEHFENEYMQGTPDVIIKDEIIDAKNSWDCFTFPLFNDVIDSDYYAQLQGYMEITGKQKARLVYVLSDTPEELIQDEIRRFSWKMGFIETPEEVEETIHKNMTYDNIPDDLKIKSYEIIKDEAYIEAVTQRVLECRNYISELLKSIK